MKKLLLLLLISTTMAAQIKKAEVKYNAINIATDPYAMYQEGGLNISFEYEHVENFGYVKVGVEFFPVLDGGYNFLYTAFGFNLKVGNFNNWRPYSGVKAGFVNRGKELYGNFGGEAGINYVFNNGAILGLKTDAIYRSDFLWSGADPEFQGSGYIVIAFKLN